MVEFLLHDEHIATKVHTMTRTRIALLILPMLIIVAGPAHAQRYLLTPAITLQGTYDDNVFFVEDDDFEYYLGPSLTLDAQTERSSLNLLAALHIYRYGSYDEFDRVNQSYLLSGSHRMTEQLTFTLGAGYQRDKTFDVALEELALVVEPEDRNIYSIAPGFAYEINPRTELSLTYQFEAVDYDEDINIDNIFTRCRSGCHACSPKGHRSGSPAWGAFTPTMPLQGTEPIRRQPFSLGSATS
jgi:hypothetical protein